MLLIEGDPDAVAQTTIDEARAAGLFHPRCRHQAYGWWPEYDGLPTLGTPDPEGYAASQKQRGLERVVRRERLLADAEAATGGVSPARAQRLADARRALREHVDVWEARGVVKRSRWREVPMPGDMP